MIAFDIGVASPREDDDDPAAAFLAALDPYATAWTFQTFDDKRNARRPTSACDGRRPELTRIIHGSIDAAPRATPLRLNDAAADVFVTKSNRPDRAEDGNRESARPVPRP
jgi:hypothetical protein